MLENSTFYGFFLAQLLIISIYLPRRVYVRMNEVIARFPPNEYPKLYPGSAAGMQAQSLKFMRYNMIILVLGLLILSIIGFWDMNNPGNINEMLPVGFMLLQMTPMIMLEMSERQTFQAMKAADVRTKRMSDLTPRRLFDFVSPVLVLLALVAIIFSVAIDVYLNQHIETYALGVGHGTFMRTLVLILCNVLFAVIVYHNMYGKKLDPYQDNKDRMLTIEATIKSLLYMSIAMSIYFSIREGTDDMGIDHLQAAMMSLYCTVIAFMSIGARLNTLKIKRINFDVYKADNSVNS